MQRISIRNRLNDFFAGTQRGVGCRAYTRDNDLFWAISYRSALRYVAFGRLSARGAADMGGHR